MSRFLILLVVHSWYFIDYSSSETMKYVTLVWSFSPVLLQTASDTMVYSFQGCSQTKHQSEGHRTRNVTKPVNEKLSSFLSGATSRYFIQQIPDLVSHYGKVIHPQFTGIYSDFPQSLSCISVEQDPEPLVLLVERFYSLTDLPDWLTRDVSAYRAY